MAQVRDAAIPIAAGEAELPAMVAAD